MVLSETVGVGLLACATIGSYSSRSSLSFFIFSMSSLALSILFCSMVSYFTKSCSFCSSVRFAFFSAWFTFSIF